MPSAKGGKKKRGDGTTTHARFSFCATEDLADPSEVQLATNIAFKRTTCTACRQGRTKLVYGLVIKDLQYVAKQLINIGQGPVHGGVEPKVAVKYLTADLIHLTRMRSLAGQFMLKAQTAGAEVADFCISKGFLIGSGGPFRSFQEQ
ncbi:hypothetical protein HGRIS_003274 [Hohenbuehelia grisea]|uniref:Uncharacterized protein n=1 Tax=Hohenbuehelia grisea TaxID=104357 RepID=A0ABR3JPB1_9AGAR